MALDVTPKSLVLDMLRVARPRAMPVAAFVTVGELLGLKENAIRVAITRLVRKNLLQSDDRGWYEFAAGAAPVSEHVEQWRLGEKRTQPWQGDWVAVWLPRGADRSERRHSLKALRLLGLREGLDSMWVRPNNLAAPFDALSHQLETLGLESGAEPFLASHFESSLTQRWQTKLWPTRQLNRGYADALADLRRSSEKLGDMPLEKALVESYLLGGEAIRVLATDPLLPCEMVDTDARGALSEAMLAYDALGRRSWGPLFRTRFASSTAAIGAA